MSVMFVFQVFALDCEMCSTTMGSELTRVTVIEYSGKTCYESLVKPDNDIIDYNTRSETEQQSDRINGFVSPFHLFFNSFLKNLARTIKSTSY